jgi:SAM-dependent methyltransferase
MNNRSRRERDHFNSLADETGSVWWGTITKAGQLRLDERAGLAIQHGKLASGRVVLEPGAGNGEFTKRLAASGATVIGVEISSKQVELANNGLESFPNAQVVEGDIAQLNFVDGYFDAIVGNSVLHHFDLAAALPEMRRVLKEGGWLFFSEPNMLNPQIAVEKNIKCVGRVLQNSPDETAFFRWQIKATLTRHGFKEVCVRPFDFLHPGTPEPFLQYAQTMSRMLGRIPVIKEFAGSLQIIARG